MREEFPVVNRFAGKAMPPHYVQMITCKSCPGHDAVAAHQGRRAADVIGGIFQTRGWIVGDRGKHVCPACRKAARRQPKKDTSVAETIFKTPVPPRSPVAQSKLGDLYMILSEAYVGADKTYKAGWSDVRIAKETGLAEEFVKLRREQDFGPLVVDTLAEDLRAAIKVMAIEQDKLRDGVAAVMRLVGNVMASENHVERLATEALKRLEPAKA